jgi:hypothetical protein
MANDADDNDAKLAAEWERLEAEYGEDAVLRFSRKVKKREGPKGRGGRPLLADEVALSTMADLLYTKAQASERGAAAAGMIVVEGLEITSTDATIHRLCRKHIFVRCRPPDRPGSVPNSRTRGGASRLAL